jgi:hypothetical protein
MQLLACDFYSQGWDVLLYFEWLRTSRHVSRAGPEGEGNQPVAWHRRVQRSSGQRSGLLGTLPQQQNAGYFAITLIKIIIPMTEQ